MKTPYPLILASTSKYRAELLAKLGIDFTSEAPGVDEDKLKKNGLSPRELALELSKLKARAIFKNKQATCVIGSDQVCSFGDEIFSKPHTMERAVEQLLKMNGKSHSLFTAVTVASPKGEHTFVNETKLHMRKLNLASLEKYVRDDMPLDCAGSYKLESLGIKLFHKIEMEDQTAIIGLPLMELHTHLLDLGYLL